MFNLVIDERQWLYGRDEGVLLDTESESHNRCCIGILCSALGVPDSALDGTASVADLNNKVGLFGKGETDIKGLPHEAIRILGAGENAISRPDIANSMTSVFGAAYAMNDEECHECRKVLAAKYPDEDGGIEWTAETIEEERAMRYTCRHEAYFERKEGIAKELRKIGIEVTFINGDERPTGSAL